MISSEIETIQYFNVIKMVEENYNPKEGLDCHSCGYKESLQGSAHKSCLRNFQVGKFMYATLNNEITKKSEQVAVYIDQTSAKMVVNEDLSVQVACTLNINQWSRMFPLDYDPRWVVVCTGWSKKPDKQFVTEKTAMERMIGVLGSAGRI